MSIIPASPFAAGSQLTTGRELTAAELIAFNRQRRIARVTLAGVAIGVPMLVGLLAWGGTRERVDLRTRYYGTGVKEMTAEYLGGKKHGAYVDYYRNGQLRSSGHYENDRPVGDWTYWSYTGMKQAEGSYQKGYRDGVWQLFHHDGTPKRHGRYHLGVQEGTWLEWHENGQLERETTFLSGLADGIERRYHANGRLAEEVTFERGIENGPSRVYDENGTLLAAGELAYGQRHGRWTATDVDGKTRTEVWYGGLFMGEEGANGELVAAARTDPDRERPMGGLPATVDELFIQVDEPSTITAR